LKTAMRALIETGFMLALNPEDKHHEWAMKTLEEAKRGEITLYISPAAPIELSLIMKAKGLGDDVVARALNAIETIINRYAKLHYPQLGLRELIHAAKLRARHPELTFFDSIHAAVAIINNLAYYDLDQAVKNIVVNELGK